MRYFSHSSRLCVSSQCYYFCNKITYTDGACSCEERARCVCGKNSDDGAHGFSRSSILLHYKLMFFTEDSVVFRS